MKITRVGTKPEYAVWVGECRNCHSTAEALQLELKHITRDQRDGDFSWEECPVCSAGANENGYGGMLFYPVK